MSTPPGQDQQGQAGGDNKPIRIPLASDLGNRGENAMVDSRLINCYAEKQGQDDYWIYKRPGLIPFSQPTGGAAIGRGVFNWNGDIYSIFNGNFYKNGGFIGNVANALLYHFDSILGATPSLFFHNGLNFYQYNTTTGLTAVNPTSLGQAVPGTAYLDGTMYLCDPTAHIVGSNLNDLSTWAGDNVIVAQIEPDKAIALHKQLVYVICFKTYSTEMFYDAGNATGSPLGAVPGQKLNYGIRHADTLCEIAGVLLWVDAIKTGGLSVRIMDQLTAQPCSTPQVERLLQGAEVAGDFAGPIFSWSAKIDGHMFYCLTIQNLNYTLVFDITQKIWYIWTNSLGNYMPIIASTFNGGQTLVQGQSDGWIYTLSTNTGTDNGAIITSDIYTPEFDGGTYRKKLIDKMRFIGDVTPGNVLQVRVSDDDFDSFSNFRTVDMGQKRPQLDNCGTFGRRVWNIRQSTIQGGRLIKAIEPEIEVGDL